VSGRARFERLSKSSFEEAAAVYFARAMLDLRLAHGGSGLGRECARRILDPALTSAPVRSLRIGSRRGADRLVQGAGFVRVRSDVVRDDLL